jgi:hypothetical protein
MDLFIFPDCAITLCELLTAGCKSPLKRLFDTCATAVADWQMKAGKTSTERRKRMNRFQREPCTPRPVFNVIKLGISLATPLYFRFIKMRTDILLITGFLTA